MNLIKYRHFLHSKIVILLIITLVWVIADNMLELVFPTYLETINKSYIEIGFLLSLASIAGISIDLPIGSLCDKISRKKIMLTGLILSIITAILIFSFRGNLLLVLAFLFWGFGYQIWRIPRDAQFAALTKQNKRAELYGMDTEFKYIGETIGPLIGGVILLYLGFKGIVSMYIALLVLAILLIILFIKETNHRSVKKAIQKMTHLKTAAHALIEFHSFGFFGGVLLFFSLLFSAWWQILWTFGPLFYGPDILNISSSMGGLLIAFFSLPGIFLSYHFGKAADKFGKRKILFIGLIITGVSLVVFSNLTNIILVFITALFVSIGCILSLPALNGLIVDISYKQKKGEISGVWNLCMDVGYILGPLLGGVIAEFFGLRHVFLIMGLIFIATSSMVILLYSKFKPSTVAHNSKK